MKTTTMRMVSGLGLALTLVICGCPGPRASKDSQKQAQKQEEKQAEKSGAAAPGDAASAPGEVTAAGDTDEYLSYDSVLGQPAADTGETPAGAPAKAPTGPFVAPPWEELNAKAGWIDQPVGNALHMLREAQQKTKPLVTASAALALKNTSKESNKQILSALGRVATDESEIDYEAVMNRHIRRDVKSTNPIMSSATEEGYVNSLTGLSFLAFDWTFAPFGDTDVLESWQTSKDRLLDKFVMRKDLTWSDGRPVTAHDVVFSYKTIMDNRVPVPAVRSGTDELWGVHAYDDHTVVVFHKESLATNVWNATFPIIPRHVYEKSIAEDPTLQTSAYHVDLENKPVCGGAYTITSRTRGQEIVLTRRESWYMHNGKQVRKKPYFREVRFRLIEDGTIALIALKKGEIDEMELTAELWMTRTSDDDFYRLNTKVSSLEWTEFQFVWNLKSPFFSDLKVRQAMSYAFDYQEMHEKLNYNLYSPSSGIFHPTAWMAPKPAPKPYTQDLDKAEKLLDEAGWTDHDGDGTRDKMVGDTLTKFEFNILTPPIPERIKLCTLLKESLDKIGVICNVQPLEPTVLQEKMLKKEFQASFGGWQTGADPDTSKNIWKSGEQRNFGSYANPEVDALFLQAAREFHRAKRAEIYGKIHTLIYNDQPYTWLYFRNSFFAFNKRLRGYNFSPGGPYRAGPGFGAMYKVKER
jgi:peptide/nickel transport system substrate-binding protein